MSRKKKTDKPEKSEPADRDVASARGISGVERAKEWFGARTIEEIECLVPDQGGVARGKIMPVSKFLKSPVMNLPLSIFYQCITGEYPAYEGLVDAVEADTDMFMQPDWGTLTSVPWAMDPTAQVIHDAVTRDGRPVEQAPRQVLRRVRDFYRKKGWLPVVAPEIEFYLVEPNTDADYPLKPPVGRSGRPEIGRQGYSISAVNEFDALFEDIYKYSEQQGLEIDTLIHEDGAAQMEINLRHGDPLELADQVFLFKRTIREASLQHKIYATFMAKPIAGEPGSALHIHQSIVDAETGNNIFSDPDTGAPTPLFFSFLAGQQKYLPAIMCMLAPYVNSYRRLTRDSMAPINVQWGYDNRTAGLRVPPSGPEARRVENRVPSSDANPYLAIAAVLAAGYLGMTEELEATSPIETDAKNRDYELPRGLLEAVAELEDSEPVKQILGSSFVTAFSAIKKQEYETFMRVISPWEREHLLLNV
ncbi:glutamine synthetase family protein [Labrys monachus]|uniref:Glutamine synthetase n=1 Tax=Labrys monachus TaxID=217067 RepID=A0ABU0FDP6_9HYPH|nr:glutamine synthetase family protein [Labrys monachus]MDQ0392728.1 glutamine synthetase [Labrys monachus]